MAESDSISESPMTLWSAEVGDYHIRCVCQETPLGTATVTVVENGVEKHRKVFTGEPFDASDEATAYAERLYPKYSSRIIEATRRTQPKR